MELVLDFDESAELVSFRADTLQADVTKQNVAMRMGSLVMIPPIPTSEARKGEKLLR